MSTAIPTAPTRRAFLKKGILGGALLSLGGVGFLLSRATQRAALPAGGLRVLDPIEYSVLLAVAARLLPPSERVPSVQEVGVALNADRVLMRADPGVRKELKQLLRLFENALAGFLFGGRTRCFTQLTAPEQDEVLREWQNSRLAIRRTGFSALRTLVTASYYGSRTSWSAIGYPGPPEGFWQPDAPVWVGAGAQRPPSP